jgi:hypothetical protein
MASPPSAEFIAPASMAPFFSGLGSTMEAFLAQEQASSAAFLAQEQASSAAFLATLPRPPVLASGGCDNLLCLQGGALQDLDWDLLACSRCFMAQYCSPECQRQCWRASFVRTGDGGAYVLSTREAAKLRQEQPQLPHRHLWRFSDGHGEFCGKLSHAPPPLRLVSRWVPLAGLVSIRPTAASASSIDEATSHWTLASDAEAANCHTLASTLAVSLTPEEPRTKDAAAVQRILTRLAPQRLLLAVIHGWGAAEPHGDASGCSCTLFEVQLDPAVPLSGAALLKLMSAALAYIFVEEDRLAPDVQYAPGGTPRVGMKVPPLIAEALHYQLDAEGRLVGMAPSGPPQADGSIILRILPRLRWATPKGPFRVSSMCMEDLELKSVSFSHLDPLYLMSDGDKMQRLHAADKSFVCTALFRA